MGVEPINPPPSQNLQLSTYNSAPLKSVDILALYKFVYYGAVLPRRRPHHVLILSICLSLPCLHLEGKQKGLRIPNLVGRVPGTPAPRGPSSRIPAVAGVSRPYPLYQKASVPPPRGKTKRLTNTNLGRKGKDGPIAKTVHSRTTKSSPSAAWKTLVSGPVKLFHKFEGGLPERGR